jgi:tetratricopeptide (TPR) repeat protein
MAGRQDIFQQAMNQGHSAAWDQQWDKASGFYRQALDEFPDHPQALINLGLALIELQDFDQALNCYMHAARVIPEDPIPVEKIGQLSERMGNLEQASKAALRAADIYLKNRDVSRAIENLERVTRLNPESLLAYSRLAIIYERTGDKHKSVSAYLAAASLLQSSGELEKAMHAVDQALKILPNNEKVLQAKEMLRDYKQLPKPVRPRGGTAPLRMSQVRQLQSPEKATTQPEIDPVALARQKALTILAGMLFDSMEDEPSSQSERRGLQAIVTDKSGIPEKPVDHTRLMLHLSQVIDFQTRGENNQAAEELQRAMDSGLENPAAFFDLGFLYASSGRVESAIRQLQRAVRHTDFALGGRLLLGDLFRKKGLLKEASLEYLEALKIADAQTVTEDQAHDLLQLYEPLIESYRQESNPEMEVRICDNVQEMLMRSNWRAHLQSARQQLPEQGKKGPAIPLAEILTEAHSSELIESISKIYTLVGQSNIRSAMEEAFFAIEHAPSYLPLHSVMGDMLVKQGETASAVSKYQVVAKSYSVRGESQQAIKYYRKVVELAPTDPNSRVKLIDQLVSYGQTENAIEEYLQLADIYISLADLNMARKTYTDALRTAQQANVDRSQRVKILHRMADIDMQSLDWRQALRVFDQIRTLQADDLKAWSNLIELNFALGQEQQALKELDNYITYFGNQDLQSKALEFLENMCNEYPDRIPVRRRLADLYKKLGRIEDSIDQLDALGDLLLESGDRAATIQTVEMILALNPPNKDDYEEVLRQLRNG